MFLLFLEYLLLSSSVVVAKVILAYAKPFFTIGFRMILAGLILLCFQFLIDRKKFVLKHTDWWLFFKTSIFHIYLVFIPAFWALQYLSSAKVNLIHAMNPLIAAVLSYFLLYEKLSMQKIFALFIAFIGIIPVVFIRAGSCKGLLKIFLLSLPDLVLIVTMISATYAWFIIKILMKEKYPLFMINGVSMFGGGILCLLTSFLMEGFQTFPIYDMWPFLGWSLVLIFMVNIVGYNLYAWLIGKYSVTFVSFAAFLYPVFGAFLGWFFLNERISWPYFSAMAFISFGLYLFYKDEIRV